MRQGGEMMGQKGNCHAKHHQEEICEKTTGGLILAGCNADTSNNSHGETITISTAAETGES